MGNLERTQQPLTKQGIGGLVGNIFAVEKDVAGIQRNCSGDDVEYGRFTAPFGPIMPVMEPFSILKLQSLMTFRRPNDFWTDFTSIMDDICFDSPLITFIKVLWF